MSEDVIIEQPEITGEIKETNESTAEEKQPELKTFTQEQLDEIIQREKGKAYRKAQRELQPAQPMPAQQVSDRPPARTSFASDEEWLDARDDWRDSQKAVKAAQQQELVRNEQIAINAEKLYVKAEKLAEFDREVFDSLPITATVAGIIMESDIASKIMAYMSVNPDEAERISELSQAKQALEMGKIEEKLSKTKTSNAPDPITPIGGKAGSTQNKAIESMTHDEYVVMRRKQGAKWG